MNTWRGVANARRIALGTISALMLASFGAAPTSAAGPLSFWVDIGDNCVGVDSEPDANLDFAWKDSDGNLKLQTTSVSAGFFWFCSAEEHVEVGDRLRVSQGATVHRLTVPELSIRLLRVPDNLKGTGPQGARLRVLCDSADPFRHFEPCIWKKTVYADSNGNWSANVPFDFIGDARMLVRWRNAAGDQVHAWGTAPFVQVTLGRSTVTGATRPNETASVHLDSGAAAFVAGDPFDGHFEGQFVDVGDEPVLVQAGDSLSSSNIAADANWIVPEIEATASAISDIVSGRCHDTGASRELVNVLLYRYGTERGWALLDTQPDGTFAFDFVTGDGDFWTNVGVRSGDRLVVRCMQAEGDWVQRVIFAA